VALHRREEEDEDTAPGFTLSAPEGDEGAWSEADKAFLRTFRISM